MRVTLWGLTTYTDYRYRVDFCQEEYEEIDHCCKEKSIAWFASCGDKPFVDFIEQFGPVCYKIATASLTDDQLLPHINAKGRPMFLATDTGKCGGSVIPLQDGKAFS